MWHLRWPAGCSEPATEVTDPGSQEADTLTLTPELVEEAYVWGLPIVAMGTTN